MIEPVTDPAVVQQFVQEIHGRLTAGDERLEPHAQQALMQVRPETAERAPERGAGPAVAALLPADRLGEGSADHAIAPSVAGGPFVARDPMVALIQSEMELKARESGHVGAAVEHGLLHGSSWWATGAPAARGPSGSPR